MSTGVVVVVLLLFVCESKFSFAKKNLKSKLAKSACLKNNKPHFETVFWSSLLYLYNILSLSLSLFSSLLNNKWNRRRRETPPPSYYHHWSTPKTASHLLERRDEWTLFQPGIIIAREFTTLLKLRVVNFSNSLNIKIGGNQTQKEIHSSFLCGSFFLFSFVFFFFFFFFFFKRRSLFSKQRTASPSSRGFGNWCQKEIKF